MTFGNRIVTFLKNTFRIFLCLFQKLIISHSKAYGMPALPLYQQIKSISFHIFSISKEQLKYCLMINKLKSKSEYQLSSQFFTIDAIY